MSVTVAKTAGFCFGVRRAVDLAEQQAKKNGKIYAYGEIIHNMHEIERLEKLGVYTVYALEDSYGPEHAKIFSVRVDLPDGRQFRASGPGLKRAEQEAAHVALVALGEEDGEEK